jgi:hypothetical protein
MFKMRFFDCGTFVKETIGGAYLAELLPALFLKYIEEGFVTIVKNS